MYRYLDRNQVVVRHSQPTDSHELAKLAALDSARVPEGPALVAESDARILAALPIGCGRAIADPFEPTAELVALLELRREQLRREKAQRRPRRSRLRALLAG
jgi:hypothetical protein